MYYFFLLIDIFVSDLYIEKYDFYINIVLGEIILLFNMLKS